MNLRLSWDLFIVVFFAIVTAYSLIIGRNQTLKVIISTYISILCADGIGNILSSSLSNSAFFQKLISFFGIAGGVLQTTFIVKISLLIIGIVFLTRGSLFEVEVEDHTSFVRLGVLILFSILSAGLMVSTIIVFANGGSLITGSTSITSDFGEIYKQSRLVQIMLEGHNLWFAAPAVAFVVMSILSKKSSK